MASEQTGIWAQPAAPSVTRESPTPSGADDALRTRRRRPGAAEEPTGPGGWLDRLPRLSNPIAGARHNRTSRRGRKVRRVHRVIRHFEIWSVFKVAAVFATCSYVVALVSGYILWRAADRVGTIDGIEGFMEDAGGYDRYQIMGDVVFRSAAVLLAVLAAFAVFVVVLGAVLFNLISDLTGGIRMTVIDEDLIVTPVRRRPPTVAPTAGPAPAPASSPPPSDVGDSHLDQGPDAG